MGVIITRSPWTRQPQTVAATSPKLPMYGQNWSQRGQFAGMSITDTTASDTCIGGKGLALNSSVSSTSTFVTNTSSAWLCGATQATFAIAFFPKSVPSGTTEERLFGKWGSAYPQFLVQMRGTEFGVAACDGTTYEARQTTGASFTANRVYFAVCTWNASRSGDDRHRFWINGQKLNSSSAWYVSGDVSALNTAVSGSSLTFGTDADNGPKATNTILLDSAVVPVDIGDAAARELSGNYWASRYSPLPRRIWVPSAGGGGAYTLTASAGSYSLTGQSAALVAARKIAAAQGAYALTGQATGVKAGRKVAAAQGAYSLTGQAAGLRASRRMAAAQGSYALTGQAAGFLRGRALLAAQGAYALTGQAAGLRVARKFAAAQGAYALNGQVAALNYSGSGSKTLLAGQGSYTLNGQALNLRAARRLPAVAGAYSLAGQAVTLTKTGVGYTLTAAQGAYAITGRAVGLRAARRMAANYGAYTLSGQVVTLSYSGVVPPTVVAMSSAPLHRRADGLGRASQLSTGRRVAPPNGYRS